MSNRAKVLLDLARKGAGREENTERHGARHASSSGLQQQNPVEVRQPSRQACRKRLFSTSDSPRKSSTSDAGAARLIPFPKRDKQTTISVDTLDSNEKVKHWLDSHDQEEHPSTSSSSVSELQRSEGEKEPSEPTVLIVSNNNIEERLLSSLLVHTNEIVIPVSNEVYDLEIQGAENSAGPELTTPATKEKKTRKRSCTPAEWKHNVAKKSLDSGEDHYNVKGVFRPGKKMKLACVCKAKCFLKISEEQRLAVHNMYWKKLADKKRQWEYIYNHSPTSQKSTNTTGNQNSRREKSRKYFLGILNESNVEIDRVQVCKVMFTNTLNIGDGVIVTAHKHSQKGVTTPDKRGKHSNRVNRATEVQKEHIRKHINSFPRVPAHYVRAKCQREYVQCGLSINKMCKEYKKWCDTKLIPVKERASRHVYRKVLNTEFNIGFYKPKKDQCQLCNLFKKAPRAERESVLKEKWIAHKRNKEAAYDAQRKARKLLTQRREVAMCTFDLQKVLPCPRSETSVFFYKNKLSVFNLTVYDVRTHIGKCYVWHEGIAKRGANEIGSCLFNHISDCAKDGIKEVHSFSDSCSGQNRNRFVYAMLLLAAEKFGVRIRHCFLEPGHTYNEGDSVHATIEKAAKLQEIFDLDEWVRLIETAKVENPPYQVKRLERMDIKNFHDLVLKQNWEKDTTGQKITWNKVKILEAGFHGCGNLGVQYGYNGPMHILNTNQKRGHPVNLKSYNPPCAYEGRIPIREKTVEHLRELCAKHDIPVQYHKFFEDVIAGVEPTEDDDRDDPQVVEDSHDPDEVIDDNGDMEKGNQQTVDTPDSDEEAETDGSEDLFGDE